jgi:hypothetical protein
VIYQVGEFFMTIEMQLLLLLKSCAINGLVVATLFVVSPIATYACNIQNQSLTTGSAEAMKFRFEDYSKAEDAEKKLRELFPIDSDINQFTNVMELIKGTECTKSNTGVGCVYFVPISEATAYGWYVSVSGKNGKITNLHATRSFTPYYPPGMTPQGLPRRTK